MPLQLSSVMLLTAAFTLTLLGCSTARTHHHRSWAFRLGGGSVPMLFHPDMTYLLYQHSPDTTSGVVIFNDPQPYPHPYFPPGTRLTSLRTHAVHGAIDEVKSKGQWRELGDSPVTHPQLPRATKWDAAFHAAREGRLQDIPMDLYIKWKGAWDQVLLDGGYPPYAPVTPTTSTTTTQGYISIKADLTTPPTQDIQDNHT